MDSGIEPETIVTLVHGTFATRAAWCQPNSAFRKALEATFGPHCISVFEWSAVNSHTERLYAAEDLQDFLRRSLEQHPDADHFLVAHSHGGNVSAYALRDDNLNKRVRALVCIGTPFIRCTHRDLTITLGRIPILLTIPIAPITALLLMPIFAAAALLLVQVYGYSFAIPEWLRWALLFGFLVLGTLVIILATKRVQSWVSTKIDEPLNARQAEIAKRLDPPFLRYTPVLNVTASLDEAGAWLWLLRHLAAIPFYFWRTIMVLSFALYICGFFILGLKTLTRWVPIIVTALARVSDDDSSLGLATGGLGGIIVDFAIPALFFAVIAFAWHLLMFITPKLVRSSWFGFGGERFIDNLLVDIRTHSEPFAESVENLRCKVSRFPGNRGAMRFDLAHSALCRDERSIECIVAWLKLQKLQHPRPASMRIPPKRTKAKPLGLV